MVVTRLPLLSALLVCIPAIATAAAAARAADRPNVIFILTDDQGWGDARFAGHPYVHTPHLDRFAAQSTWFRQFYVASGVCSPSRCGFLTSHCPARHLIHGHFAEHGENAARHMPDWLDPATPTLASLLKEAGYATAHFGKWHLGSGPGAPTPSAYGFDVSKTTNSSGPRLGDGKKDAFFVAKSTTLIVDEAIAFMKEHRTGPFYMNLWTLLPHAKLNPTPEQLEPYATLVPTADEPAFGSWMRRYLAGAEDLSSQMRVFCASLTDLDTQLGRLFAALDELGLTDDTIIVFSSDNGPEDYRVANAANAGVGSTGPLRARKRSMYEGGIRTLGLVRWPGHVAPGRVDDTSVIAAVDLLPTVCKLTGVPLPAGFEPDGEDVGDIWLGRSRPRAKPLHWEWLFDVAGAKDDRSRPPPLAIRDGDWKLFVRYDGSGAELYDIPHDAGEEHDVAGDHPEVVQALAAQALAWATSLPPSPARDKLKAARSR